MATRLFVVDSGGTSRLVRRLPVVDSGGTTRLIKRLFAVDSGGTARLVFRSSLHETTITVGDNGAGQEGYAQGVAGSIGDATYDDGGATSRTIVTVLWDQDNAGIQMALSGINVPDSDTTFQSIGVNGLEFARSAASYNGNSGGNSRWLWAADDVTSIVGQSSVALVIR